MSNSSIHKYPSSPACFSQPNIPLVLLKGKSQGKTIDNSNRIEVLQVISPASPVNCNQHYHQRPLDLILSIRLDSVAEVVKFDRLNTSIITTPITSFDIPLLPPYKPPESPYAGVRTFTYTTSMLQRVCPL